MPHDYFGEELNVGDIVTCKMKVTFVVPSTDYCNVNLETLEPMFPEDRKVTMTLNSKQVVKVLECHTEELKQEDKVLVK